jgi:hypothetical protein
VDPDHVETLIAGIRKRVAFKTPLAATGMLQELKKFVTRWCKRNLTPFAADHDVSFETWLANAPYSQARKAELTRKYNLCGRILDKKRHFKVKSFVKDESYVEIKHARGINSRSDEFKCATGPIFHEIEKVLFKLPYFIKYVPVPDRPQYIMDNVFVQGASYNCTDYTAFESHFIADLMHSCEFVLYKHMTQHLPDYELFCYYLDKVIAGVNDISFKNIKMKISATRMSGEMCTSLGNGFSNLMFTLFLGEKCGNDVDKIRGIVEGDDGLFYFPVKAPTTEDYSLLGLTIKLVVVDDISAASFCGIIFHPDDKINIADPLKIIAQLGWTHASYVRASSKVLRGLLKSKGYSLLYQYSGCPIVSSMARAILRQLECDFVYFRKATGDWKDMLAKTAYDFIMKHQDVINKPVGLSTRLLMESQFNISVNDQLQLEAYFDHDFQVNQPITHDLLDFRYPQIWMDYSSLYQCVVQLSSSSFSTHY